MTTNFQIAGGTITGREHVAIGRNNQDAFCWSATPEATVAIVADGCGSGTHSEVGAQIGARILTEALRIHAAAFDDGDALHVLERIRQDVLLQIRQLAEAMGGSFRRVVSDYFLFTTLGFVVAPQRTVVFGIGDGLVSLNGHTQRLTAADNAPPYLGYGLVPSTLAQDVTVFTVHDDRPTNEVTSLLVATDGAFEIPDLAELWSADRYYSNPYNVGRRLVQLNRPRPGILTDDTTLVVARRAGGTR
jgi:serine/threonine protein phosphatase PrpC